MKTRLFGSFVQSRRHALIFPPAYKWRTNDTTALLIYEPPRTAPEKKRQEDRASEDDSRTKCSTFLFFVSDDLDL